MGQCRGRSDLASRFVCTDLRGGRHDRCRLVLLPLPTGTAGRPLRRRRAQHRGRRRRGREGHGPGAAAPLARQSGPQLVHHGVHHVDISAYSLAQALAGEGAADGRRVQQVPQVPRGALLGPHGAEVGDARPHRGQHASTAAEAAAIVPGPAASAAAPGRIQPVLVRRSAGDWRRVSDGNRGRGRRLGPPARHLHLVA